MGKPEGNGRLGGHKLKYRSNIVVEFRAIGWEQYI
jgi:hypothetical protein